jgi:ABC-type arginine transport system permease subunit
MNSATRENFTLYFGSPNTVFIVVMVLLVVMLGIVLLKIILLGWHDARTENGYDATDFFTTLVRGLALLLVFALIFSH